MNHSHCLLFLVLTLASFVVALGSPLRAASSGWDKLSRLRHGQPIHVYMRNSEVHKAQFVSADAEQITLRQADGEQTLARRDIASIWAKGKSHLKRNMIIGAAIGACFFAVPLQLANNRNGWWGNTAWIWWLFAGGGAGIGAAAGTGYYEVYHARGY